MNTAEFLSYLHQLDVELAADGEQLRVNAPKGILTPDLRGQLAGHKAEILAFLQQARPVKSAAPPITPAPHNGYLPLSYNQERLWFLAQLRPDSAAYNLTVAARLVGPLNTAALEWSIKAIVQRHEMLRTTFTGVNGQPMQVIHPISDFGFRISDSTQIQNPKSKIQNEIRRRFDLAQGPLWRVRLWRPAEDEHLFLVVMHHIISDGWSFDVFFNELAALYRLNAARGMMLAKHTEGNDELEEGRHSSLPALPIQYADFAIWQRRWWSGEALERQLAYWRQHLAGDVPMLQLPADRSPSAQTDQGASQVLRLPADLSQALKIMSRAEGVTLFVTLLAAFQTLLHRYTGQEDILICSPVAGRHQVETEGLIGYFNNIVALRTDLSGRPRFRELLKRVRQVVSGAYDHQDVPFQQVAALPNLTRTPLTRALFSLQNTLGRALELDGVAVTHLEVDNGTADFDLSLLMAEEAGRLIGVLQYKADLFSAEAVSQMVQRFQALLESLTAHPEQPLQNDEFGMMNDECSSIHHSSGVVAARDTWELQLAQIWRRVLGMSSIGMQDNFFGLGGHSLLAVQLVTEIERTLGRKLPLSILMQAPTVEQLAGLLRRQGWSPTWSSLTPIQAGGSRPPFFCVHGLGGQVILFRELAQQLGPDQPFYGLQAQGLNGLDAPHRRIEEMATHYVKEIRAFQPRGPYYVGSLCYGITGLEMAHQLGAQGEEVVLLVMFDPFLPPTIYRRPLHHLGRRVLYRLWRQPASLPGYFWDRVFVRPFRAATRGLRTASGSLHLDEAHLEAARQYRPQPYNGRVAFFWSDEYRFAHLPAYQQQWDGLVAGQVEHHLVPGTHHSILQMPDVVNLAEKLRACLDKARA
ncbi:MAG: condensation domain-containing protein [Chloroflexota bacterium]